MDRTEEIMNRYLDGDFQCYAAGDDAPGAAELLRVAGMYGCTLPDDFLAHATGPLGGVYIEVKESVWPRPEPYSVGPFWTFLYAMFVFGLSPDIQDWMNIELAADRFKEDTGHSLVPCLKVVGDADVYLFDSGGHIVRWRHETDELEPFSGGFFDLLELEIRSLRERKDRKRAHH